jgi:2-hydroxychromene-2-carboxylate isomerase
MKKIQYFFTPVSPWTYLGHDRLIALANQYNATIEVLPIELGAKIFPNSGGLPLGQRAPQRQAYRLVELARWRDHLKVPMHIQPQFFPVSDALALESIAAAQEFATELQVLHFAGSIMKAVWEHQLNVADPNTIDQIAISNQIDLEKLHAAKHKAHARLQANNQRAVDCKVFGAPWYRVGDIDFWGQDRLEFVELELAR